MVGSVVPRAGAGPRAGNPGRAGTTEGERGGIPSGRGPARQGEESYPSEFLLPRVPIYAPSRGHPAVPFAALLARTVVAFPTPRDIG